MTEPDTPAAEEPPEGGARPSKRRELVLGLIVLGITGVLTLAAVEVVLQIAGFPRVVSDHSEWLEPHPERGWTARAGFGQPYVSDEYTHYLGFDEDGFRVAEDGSGGPRPPLDVLVVGDSYVEGYSVPLEDRLPEVMEAPGCELSTAGFGVGGYSTAQQYLWLEEQLPALAPRHVVLMFYFNDVWYNDKPTYGASPKPYVPVDEGAAAGIETPDSVPVVERGPPRPPSLLERIKLYRLVERVAKNNPLLRGLAERLGFVRSQQSLFADGSRWPAEFLPFRRDGDPAVDRAWEATDWLLQATDSLVRSAGGRFMVAYIPMRIEVEEGSGGLESVAVEEGWDLGAVRTRLAEVCEREGLECLDLTPAFQREAAAGADLYHAIDTHWNAAGHRLAAREITAALFGPSGC